MRRARSSAFCKPISRTVPEPRKCSSHSRAATTSTRSRRCAGRRWNDNARVLADPVTGSRNRAVFARAARLAQWFLCRLVSLDGSVTPLTAEQSAALMPGAPAGDGDDGEAPWHDQSLELPDRMKLAEGRPLRRRMMAAMAQQDCGQCGYNCNDYSEAIFRKQEERLNLCVPGGKETARMLKALNEELEKAPAALPAASPAASVAA